MILVAKRASTLPCRPRPLVSVLSNTSPATGGSGGGGRSGVVVARASSSTRLYYHHHHLPIGKRRRRRTSALLWGGAFGLPSQSPSEASGRAFGPTILRPAIERTTTTTTPRSRCQRQRQVPILPNSCLWRRSAFRTSSSAAAAAVEEETNDDETSSSAAAAAVEDETNDDDEIALVNNCSSSRHHGGVVSSSDLIDPSELFDGTIPLPKSLSPSSIMEFKACPQSFLFQYLYKLKQPASLALAKGSMCHSALEKVFDLDPENRTLENLQNLFRTTWAEKRYQEAYRGLFREKEEVDSGGGFIGPANRDFEAEGAWGREGLALLENYCKFEDPRFVTRPNPVQREVWVTANLTANPVLGATGYVVAARQPGYDNNNDARRRRLQNAAKSSNVTTSSEVAVGVNGDDDDDAPATTPDTSFRVRGIIDRLDLVRVSDYGVAMRLVDYKTGKAPNLKYTPAVNRRIAEDAFFQLKIYALLQRERANKIQQQAKRDEDSANNVTTAADEQPAYTMDLRFLRLLYLTSHSGAGEATALDMDLGETRRQRDAVLQRVHAEVADVWKSIVRKCQLQDPKAWVGCDRPFCYCHVCRPRFVPGTVWEPPPEQRRLDRNAVKSKRQNARWSRQ